MINMKLITLVAKSFIISLFIFALINLIFIHHKSAVDRIMLIFNAGLMCGAAWGMWASWGRSRGLVMLNICMLVVNTIMMVVKMVGFDNVKAMIYG
ncbi:hypothetical protein [Paenibacillus aestuarii]|uniref:Uncharacterized protein n=1 Tax=Paenibacillus aestuarii TaxID=516965 RepID=A0ABW0KG56_9BACL|nr:hypothetical protein [Paenibacillus aestuarii]